MSISQAVYEAQIQRIADLQARLADLEAERELIVQRAENAEAALVAEVAKNGRHAMRVTIAQLEARLAEANAKMMLLHNESISLHTRLAEATDIINQRALELADTQWQLTEAKRDAARYRWLRDRAWPFEFNGNTPEDADAAIDKSMHLATAAKKHTPECSYWDGLMAQVCNCGAADAPPSACNHFPGQSTCEWCSASDVQLCGHPWKARHGYKCILCSSPGSAL